MVTKTNDQYSQREAQRRFMASLKAAVNTAPRPLKDIPKENGKSRASAKKRRAKKIKK
jgi:hypothetical protein